ncbi:hypothetical protein POL68_09975 [Stigmatella sp. ncwal1]|uniref:NACHT domain-containing protein n=1 Tax=Stigmatella ashevillensis TaxID=2995309 RepID=A0ABT5D554_9BACT|nr:hypothetical protein [Stigmatella ashevillena]MDC0708794.1 hypothetical protein [Stigmatella ashevillena]
MSTGIEEQLLEHTAAAAFQLVRDGLKGMKDFVAYENAIQRAMREYARKFLARYGNVKILNMEQPVPLNDIYVAAEWIPPIELKRFRSIEELQEMFLREGRQARTQRNLSKQRYDCLEIANKAQFLNILGTPGAGKSTFLRRLGLEALRPRSNWDDSVLRPLGLKAGLPSQERSRYKHDRLPILIELRRFRTEEIDLVKLLQHELTTCGLPEAERLLKALLKKGRLLLLLDGVDEVPGERLDKAITHIRDFVDRNSDNQFVISCRTAFYKDYFPRFRDVLLADFNDEQISRFVKNWFRLEQDSSHGIADEFLKILVDPANASARELANSPLLLTFLCLAYDDRQHLPPNRSELYRQALDILMERWAASKRVHNEPVYRELHSRLEVQMLAEVAAPAFQNNRYFFTRRELAYGISEFLREELNAPKHLNADQVIDAIELQQGLLVQRATDAWSFSHLTLQEYLTALWYVDNRKVDFLIDKHLSDVRWREIFILAAGIASKADDMLLQMQKASTKLLVNTPWAVQCLNWSTDRTPPADNALQGAANRAWSLYLCLEHALLTNASHSRHSMATVDKFVAVDKLALSLSVDLALDRVLSRAQEHINEIPSNRNPGHTTTINPLNHNRNVFFNLICSYLALESADVAIKKAFQDSIHIKNREETILQSKKILDSLRESVYNLIQSASEISDNKAFTTWTRPSSTLFDTVPKPPPVPSTTELRALESYLYVCQLILSCQAAATRVSRPAWEDICQRMMTPPVKPYSKISQARRHRKTRE